MNALVLFDTVFGNTQKIAVSIARGLEHAGIGAKPINIKAADMDSIRNCDLLALGAPTQYFAASKPLKQFLERLEGLNLKGKHGFAFDTKLESRFSGSAARFIEKKMMELGIEIIRARVSAIVIGQKAKSTRAGEAVLKEGMEQLFESIGKELGESLQKMAKGREA